jgi:hypothetical protein
VKTIQLTDDELRALSSKLAGWVVDGPELEALQSAEQKIVAALTGDVPCVPISQVG